MLGRLPCSLFGNWEDAASVIFVKLTAQLSGHTFNTIDSISSGLVPWSVPGWYYSLVPYFTWILWCTTPEIYGSHPHQLRQLDIFSAGQQYIEIQKHQLKPNYFWISEKNQEIILFQIAVCSYALSSHSLQWQSCPHNLWSPALVGFFALGVLHRLTSPVLRDRVLCILSFVLMEVKMSLFKYCGNNSGKGKNQSWEFGIVH